MWLLCRPVTYKVISWFQTFAMVWILYVLFWVIPRCLNFMCRHFGTLRPFHLHRQIGMKDLSYVPTRLWRWNRQSVLKRRHIKFRCQGVLLLAGVELPIWKFWPSQRPFYISLDLGHRLSSFLSSFGKCPVWCYPPICTWVFLVIFWLEVSN